MPENFRNVHNKFPEPKVVLNIPCFAQQTVQTPKHIKFIVKEE